MKKIILIILILFTVSVCIAEQTIIDGKQEADTKLNAVPHQPLYTSKEVQEILKTLAEQQKKILDYLEKKDPDFLKIVTGEPEEVTEP